MSSFSSSFSEYTNANWNFGENVSERLGLYSLTDNLQKKPHEKPQQHQGLALDQLGQTAWDSRSQLFIAKAAFPTSSELFYRQDSESSLSSQLKQQPLKQQQEQLKQPWGNQKAKTLNQLLGLEMKTKFIIPQNVTAKLSPQSRRISFSEHSAPKSSNQPLQNNTQTLCTGTVTRADESLDLLFTTCTRCLMERHVKQMQSDSLVCKKCTNIERNKLI